MPRMGTMLTDRAVRAAVKKQEPVRLYDGQGKGLRLDTTGTGHGSWIFRANLKGLAKRIEMGLGSTRDVGLAEARQLTDQCRAWMRQGKDPPDYVPCAVERHRPSAGANPARQTVAPAGSNRSG